MKRTPGPTGRCLSQLGLGGLGAGRPPQPRGAARGCSLSSVAEVDVDDAVAVRLDRGDLATAAQIRGGVRDPALHPKIDRLAVFVQPRAGTVWRVVVGAEFLG